MAIEQTDMSHVTHDLCYHFIFCPKFRQPVLGGPTAQRLADLIPPIIETLGGCVLHLSIQPDHVHLSVKMPPTLAPRQIMHQVKRVTSHRLREDFPHLRSHLPSMWTRQYYVGTAGHISAETIARYIQAQPTR